MRVFVGLVKGALVGAALGALAWRLEFGVAGSTAYGLYGAIGALVGLLAGKPLGSGHDTVWTPIAKAVVGGAVVIGLYALVVKVLGDPSLELLGMPGTISETPYVLGSGCGVLYGIFVELDDGESNRKRDVAWLALGLLIAGGFVALYVVTKDAGRGPDQSVPESSDKVPGAEAVVAPKPLPMASSPTSLPDGDKQLAPTSGDKAVDALRNGDFAAAARFATATLDERPNDADAFAIRAVSTYVMSVHRLMTAYGAVPSANEGLLGLVHTSMPAAYEKMDRALLAVDTDLAMASKNSDFHFDLCVACWVFDWNGTGDIDARDQQLLQIGSDKDGKDYDHGDSRRKPTYRFDVGDVHWARSMIAFQRAALNLLLAGRWETLPQLLELVSSEDAQPVEFRIALHDANRLIGARKLLLSGVEHVHRARRSFLSETDDVGEWMPNSKQRHYPAPFEVDNRLYRRWEQGLDDVGRLLKGDDGVSVREVATLLGLKLGKIPTGFIDLHAMFSHSHDLVVDTGLFQDERLLDEPDSWLTDLLGDSYRKTMKASPIIGRLAYLKRTYAQSLQMLRQKWMYLFWLD